MKRFEELCRSKQKRIALPEGEDPRVIQAAQKLGLGNLASKIVLLGRKDMIETQLSQLKIDLKSHLPMIEMSDPGTNNPLTLAGEMLTRGDVDAVLAGAVYTTADVVRAAISTVGLAPGNRTVSGSFVMHTATDPGYPLIFADAGVVIEPTARQLQDIATETVRTWKKLFPEKPPQVAFLSFSTHGSAQHPSAEKMRNAAIEFREKNPTILCDGELQFDAAWITDIRKKKAPNSPLTARANCFIFPNLDAANICYKVTERLARYEAIGPILQGLAKPFSDLSRGADVAAIVASACVAMLRA